jgi:asparagine synthase (glutamine-hydrolysing)
MCGIIGSIGARVDGKKFDEAMSSISHRGPDSRDVKHADGPFPFSAGHLRLSIVDETSLSSQPFTSLCRNYVLVFNGEIYNFDDIRKRLVDEGEIFRTNGDTEVLLIGLIRYGVDFLNQLNGMWAFCFIDIRRKRAVLGRDRYGEKPLYFYQKNKNLFFSSEIKGLIKLGVPLDPSEKISSIYNNCFDYESTGQTIVSGVCQVKPGHINRYEDGAVSSVKWWDTLDHLHSVPKNFSEQASEFRWLLNDAIGVRSNFTVPFSAALSGGLDSSAIVYALKANKKTSTRFGKAFFTAFPGDGLDESAFAKYVAKDLNLELRTILPQYDTYNLNYVVKMTEDPYITYPIPPIDLYANMANSGFKVSFDGHGVDELLSGYGDIRFAMGDANISDLRSIVRASNGTMGYDDPTLHFNDVVFFILSKLKKIIKINQSQKSEMDNFDVRFLELDSLTQRTFTLFHNSVMPTLLRNFDRYSMMNGIEIRLPFLDYRIVNYCFSLPWTSKVRDGYSKAILRESFANEMPDYIRLRRAKGAWNSPMNIWLKKIIKNQLLPEISGFEFEKRHASDIEKILNNESITNEVASQIWCRLIPLIWNRLYFHK